MNVLYVSYDGVLDPLGASQVIPYLVGLADRGFSITLVSFEKPQQLRHSRLKGMTEQQLATRGIRWKPLRYHRRPRLAATLSDILLGSRAIAAEVRRASPAVVHCRGDIAMLMARLARLPNSAHLLYDVRGLFADERVEIGSWARGSLVDQVVRRIEAANLQRADGAVVLTRYAAEALRTRRPRLPFLSVIPTCADVSVFKPRAPAQQPDFGLVYSGSLGTWYMAEEMVAFARTAADFVQGRTLFLTPQPGAIMQLGPVPEWAEIRTVEPGAVAEWLRRARALFFFIRPIPSKRASCPTKFAEGLASGLPVVCNRGIGDLDDIVEREGVGILVESFSLPAYATALRRLTHLLEDRALPERCRRLAETRYSAELGVEAYRKLYAEMQDSNIPMSTKRRSSS